MKSFEIYFNNLNEKTQKEFLEFNGIKNEEEGNFDLLPLATIDLEEEE